MACPLSAQADDTQKPGSAIEQEEPSAEPIEKDQSSRPPLDGEGRDSKDAEPEEEKPAETGNESVNVEKAGTEEDLDYLNEDLDE